MQFVSIYFLTAMLFIVVGYYISPGKFRYLFLLLCNILYYLSWITDLKTVLSIVSVILITWGGAWLMAKTASIRLRKAVLWITVGFTVGSLVYFKYIDFFILNVNRLFLRVNAQTTIKFVNPLIPVGISFFTFQALSYVFEIYKNSIAMEKNVLLYAAYVSFFPTVMSGPIERPQGLLRQFKRLGDIKPDFHNIRNGCLLVLWGGLDEVCNCGSIRCYSRNCFWKL